ncbi:MAG: MarR family transcriptional regulator [Actinomycetaceae bacterium]|nr:MarR family transcriptional regulator [Actinomycetaceae bacterium]
MPSDSDYDPECEDVAEARIDALEATGSGGPVPAGSGVAEAVSLQLSTRSDEEARVALWRAWRIYIETTGRMQSEIDAVLHKGAGIAIADYNLLLLLTEAPERRLRFKELAQRMSFSKSRLSYQIRSLEKRGLISREAVEGDARGLDVQLTQEGMQTFKKAARLHEKHVQALMFDSISLQEAEVLERIFTRVAKKLL